MAELSKDIAKALGEFLKSLPKPPEDGETPEFRAAVEKQKSLRAKTHKTKRHAHYIVGREGAFVGGRLYGPGEVVQVPVDAMPSKTWKPATAHGVAVAEELAAKAKAEAEELAGAAADDDALEQDELDVDAAGADDGDEQAAEEADAAEPEPTPPPAPKKPKAAAAKPKPKAGKASKPGRASDQDVA